LGLNGAPPLARTDFLLDDFSSFGGLTNEVLNNESGWDDHDGADHQDGDHGG